MEQDNTGCLGALFRLFGFLSPEKDNGFHRPERGKPGASGADELPYRLRDRFLSPAEISFFHVLQKNAGDRYHLLAKVRISDLLYVVQRKRNYKFVNQIDRKHVDFVLCDPKNMQPALAIELDDSSHAQKKRVERDQLVDEAFKVAGLPLLRVQARKSYVESEIAEEIERALVGAPVTRKQGSADTSPTETGGHPICPNCRIKMVERRAKKGKHEGKRFWACPSYPECREMKPID